MGKTISSPVKRWPGSVVLQEPMTFPVYLAWKHGLEEAGAARGEADEAMTIGEVACIPEMSQKVLSGVCACVEEWHLEGLGNLTPETFPATPRRASAALLSWLIAEITTLITAEEEIPNA